MKTYSFSISFNINPNISFEDAAEKCYQYCGDGLFSLVDGVHIVDFDREAESYGAAIESAIADIKSADIGFDIINIISESDSQKIKMINVAEVLKEKLSTPESKKTIAEDAEKTREWSKKFKKDCELDPAILTKKVTI